MGCSNSSFLKSIVGGSIKVLIVDDEPEVRSFLVSCVEMLDCDVIETAKSGEEALARAVQGQYDLVTLDLNMPGVSGIDILSVIRGMMPWSVIAIISGFTEDIPEMTRDHTDIVISKPVHVKTIHRLVELTRELVATRALIRELEDEAQ